MTRTNAIDTRVRTFLFYSCENWNNSDARESEREIERRKKAAGVHICDHAGIYIYTFLQTSNLHIFSMCFSLFLNQYPNQCHIWWVLRSISTESIRSHAWFPKKNKKKQHTPVVHKQFTCILDGLFRSFFDNLWWHLCTCFYYSSIDSRLFIQFSFLPYISLYYSIYFLCGFISINMRFLFDDIWILMMAHYFILVYAA